MKKLIVRIISIVVLVTAICLFLKFSNFDFSGISGLFKAKPISIDKTAYMVEEIHRLAELTAITYYGDYVIVKKKQREVTAFGKRLYNTENELVLIVKGKVRAGFDLSKLQEQDIKSDSASITIRLPKVQLLDVITNPSDFETFEENGSWSHEEVTKYKSEARTTIEQNAIKIGILEAAEKTGKENLASFLKALGFKNVVIDINN
jgi:hypothetical protein